jgi:hypothetical protein
MSAIPPGDLLFLALSVAAAPVGAAWLIRERKSAAKRQGTPMGKPESDSPGRETVRATTS